MGQSNESEPGTWVYKSEQDAEGKEDCSEGSSTGCNDVCQGWQGWPVREHRPETEQDRSGFGREYA